MLKYTIFQHPLIYKYKKTSHDILIIIPNDARNSFNWIFWIWKLECDLKVYHELTSDIILKKVSYLLLICSNFKQSESNIVSFIKCILPTFITLYHKNSYIDSKFFIIILYIISITHSNNKYGSHQIILITNNSNDLNHEYLMFYNLILILKFSSVIPYKWPKL